MPNKNHYFYAGIDQKEEDGEKTISVSTGGDLEKIKEHFFEKKLANNISSPKKEEEDEKNTSEKIRNFSLAQTMERTIEASNSQSNLLDIMQFMRPAFSKTVL